MEIVFETIDPECVFPASELEFFFTKLGPVGRVLDQTDPSTRAAVIDAVRPAFAPFVHGDEVRFAAACWLARAVSASPRAICARLTKPKADIAFQGCSDVTAIRRASSARPSSARA